MSVPPSLLPRGWRRDALLALAGGAIGGLVWSLYVVMVDIEPTARGLLRALMAIVLGSSAGLIGTYIVKTDRADRLPYFVVAVICGLSWRPVLEAGQNVVAQTKEKTQVLRLAERVSEAGQKIATNPSEEILVAREAAIDLLNLASRSQDPRTKAVATLKAREAIATLELGRRRTLEKLFTDRRLGQLR